VFVKSKWKSLWDLPIMPVCCCNHLEKPFWSGFFSSYLAKLTVRAPKPFLLNRGGKQLRGKESAEEFSDLVSLKCFNTTHWST